MNHIYRHILCVLCVLCAINLSAQTVTWNDSPVLTADNGQGGTDDQKILTFAYDNATKLITLTLEDGGTAQVDLSTFTAGSHSVFEQATAPTATSTGDEWKDTDNGVVSVWNGTSWIIVGQDPALVPEFPDPITAQNAGILIGMRWKASEENTIGATYGTEIIKSKNW